MSQFYTGISKQLTFVDLYEAHSGKICVKILRGHATSSLRIRRLVHTHLACSFRLLYAQKSF